MTSATGTGISTGSGLSEANLKCFMGRATARKKRVADKKRVCHKTAQLND